MKRAEVRKVILKRADGGLHQGGPREGRRNGLVLDIIKGGSQDFLMDWVWDMREIKKLRTTTVG